MPEEAGRRPFDKLRANGEWLIPFVVSLSNQERIQPVQTLFKAFVALGANLGDPPAQLEQALLRMSQLPGTRLIARSQLYRSAPLGPEGQADYCNAVAALDTTLAPEALLDALQGIEADAGRVRGEHWGARTLDLDLLLVDGCTSATPRLSLPHPQLANRRFVLQPLAEIAPDLELPGHGPITQRLAALPPWEVQPWT